MKQGFYSTHITLIIVIAHYIGTNEKYINNAQWWYSYYYRITICHFVALLNNLYLFIAWLLKKVNNMIQEFQYKLVHWNVMKLFLLVMGWLCKTS